MYAYAQARTQLCLRLRFCLPFCVCLPLCITRAFKFAGKDNVDYCVARGSMIAYKVNGMEYVKYETHTSSNETAYKKTDHLDKDTVFA